MLSNPYEEIERLRKLCGEAAKYVGCGLNQCHSCGHYDNCVIVHDQDVAVYIDLKEASEEK